MDGDDMHAEIACIEELGEAIERRCIEHGLSITVAFSVSDVRCVLRLDGRAATVTTR
jgi:hypothetical protein